MSHATRSLLSVLTLIVAACCLDPVEFSGRQPPSDGGPDAGIDAGVVDGGHGSHLSCTIGGESFPARARNPESVGQCCNPVLSPHAWLPLFAPGTATSVNGGPNDGLVADFNGDGTLDVALVTSSPEDVYVYYGLSDGGFQADPFTASGGSWALELAAGDLNHDGRPDLVVASGGVLGNPPQLKVWLSAPGGSFSQPQTLGRTCGDGPVQLGDVNGDGWLDAVVGGCSQVGVFLNQGGIAPGKLLDEAAISTQISAKDLQVFDLNGDGLADIAVDDGLSSLSVFMGSAGLEGTAKVQGGFSGPSGFATGDFGAGTQLAVNLSGSNSLAGMSLSSGGLVTISPSAGLDVTGQRALAADLDGDGLVDVLSFSGQTVDLSFNAGSGHFLGAAPIDIGPGWAQMIGAGDINGDGATDLVVFYGNGPFAVFLNNCP